MKLTCAIDRISEDLERQDLKEAAMRLANYVYTHKKTIKHLTYSALGEAAETKSQEIVLLLARYCTGSRIGLLDQKFELILQGSIIQLEDEYIYEAMRDGILINPSTGVPVENYKEHLFSYFVPGSGVE